ncbi:GNAT family N-acetyltransferase [Ornithinibacillus xuwenensis]|uniref:GNAT family N-acetyltransferase n=1 Tax=Ornithinibacillus xuwenensis TaxID=3144668 RepID=A0ABU9XF35_9BACI
MISELKKDDYYKCSELLNRNGQIEAIAVIEGVNPGRVFVDNLDLPSSGLIWLGNNDGFIFIGDEANEAFNGELNNFIDSVIIPEAKKVGLNWFEGIGNHEKWYKIISSIFKHRELGSWNQRVYKFLKENDDCKDLREIEQGYKVVKISEALFYNVDNTIHNIDFLHDKISEFWSTPEDFFHVGIGYCVVYQKEIVSICFSGFVIENTHCIDIETLPRHQGKKLAQNIAEAFVQDCIKNNDIAYWDCMESNKPSIAVAEKIGFHHVFNYVGYDFKLA